jgi:hypothetical protein
MPAPLLFLLPYERFLAPRFLAAFFAPFFAAFFFPFFAAIGHISVRRLLLSSDTPGGPARRHRRANATPPLHASHGSDARSLVR